MTPEGSPEQVASLESLTLPKKKIHRQEFKLTEYIRAKDFFNTPSKKSGLSV